MVTVMVTVMATVTVMDGQGHGHGYGRSQSWSRLKRSETELERSGTKWNGMERYETVLNGMKRSGTVGHGTVTVWSRYGHGMVTFSVKNERITVENFYDLKFNSFENAEFFESKFGKIRTIR
jgi:hypothetical protein